MQLKKHYETDFFKNEVVFQKGKDTRFCLSCLCMNQALPLVCLNSNPGEEQNE